MNFVSVTINIKRNKKIRNYDDISNYGKEREYLTENSIYNLFKDFQDSKITLYINVAVSKI